MTRRLVYVHGCWVWIEGSEESLEKAEALLYEGAPLATDCTRVMAEAQERIRSLGRVVAAWPAWG